MQNQIEIDIQIKSKKWLEIKNIEKFIQKNCGDLILLTEIKSYLAKNKNRLELSISLVSNAQIKKINYQFRNKNKATDVLSFPAIDRKILQQKNLPQIFLGDIVLAFETIKKEASLSKKDFYDHLTHLLLHSLLHLIGYDHESINEAEIMEKIEIKILKKIGIKNPYQAQ